MASSAVLRWNVYKGWILNTSEIILIAFEKHLSLLLLVLSSYPPPSLVALRRREKCNALNI
jgi:hypothetical protein